MTETSTATAQIARLTGIMRALRDPETGCPWDIEQTHASIARYAVEEAHEVVEAIEDEDWTELCAELGDLLLQVVFHAQMAEEAGRFDFAQVAQGICDKMIRRHPHVFGDAPDRDVAGQLRDWEAQKEAERGAARTLDGVARSLPALSRALKLQARAARVGFDWNDPAQVLAKLDEERAEFAEAVHSGDQSRMRDEMGDMLFVLANLARHHDIDPEEALRGTNRKFTRRFEYIEDALRAEGRTPREASLEEMDGLWTRAKRENQSGD